jgi:hypothetical protein
VDGIDVPVEGLKTPNTIVSEPVCSGEGPEQADTGFIVHRHPRAVGRPLQKGPALEGVLPGPPIGRLDKPPHRGQVFWPEALNLSGDTAS